MNECIAYSRSTFVALTHIWNGYYINLVVGVNILLISKEKYGIEFYTNRYNSALNITIESPRSDGMPLHPL